MNEFEEGFIDINYILEYVTEEDVFQLVFGFKPEEYQYTTSPFRDDNNPGCVFRYNSSGRLVFSDYANPTMINGRMMSGLDCFSVVQKYFNIPNLYQTLLFIKERLIDGKNLTKLVPIERKPNQNTIIIPTFREFERKDKRFWGQYGISSKNLLEDKVYPLSKFEIISRSKSTIVRPKMSYAYTDFPDGRLKVYSPYESKIKFVSTCNIRDVGNFDNLPISGDLLIISKSYKDNRVLINSGGYNCIWVQGETIPIPDDILVNLGSRFDKIVVFYDNDSTGTNYSNIMSQQINSFYPNKASSLYIPEEFRTKYNVKDPSDMYKYMGKKNLDEFLKEKL